MEKNGEKFNKFVLSMAFMLLGMVISGTVGIARGDWLGETAAKAVETRVNERMDRELGYLKEDLKDLKQQLNRIEDLLRSKQ